MKWRTRRSRRWITPWQMRKYGAAFEQRLQASSEQERQATQQARQEKWGAIKSSMWLCGPFFWVCAATLCGMIAVLIVLIKVVFPIVLPLLVERLGIHPLMAFILLLGMVCRISINEIDLSRLFNIPICLFFRQDDQIRCELFPIVLLKSIFSRSHNSDKYYAYFGINIFGGLMPVLIAMYQLRQAAPGLIMLVTLMATIMAYVAAQPVPGTCIYIRHLFLRIVLPTSLAAILISYWAGGGNPASIAFAGAVFGCLIGADLLHLNDVQPERASYGLSIGGAGFDDGILVCGLWSLILAEWLPKLVGLLKF